MRARTAAVHAIASALRTQAPRLPRSPLSIVLRHLSSGGDSDGGWEGGLRDTARRHHAGTMLGDSSRLPDAGREKEAWKASSSSGPVNFAPKKALVLTKLSRLQFERRTNPGLSQTELEAVLKERGSDYGQLVERHEMHVNYLAAIERDLAKRDIQVRIVQRWDYTAEAIAWADVVFSAGGDGTFLLAASKLRDPDKALIGINTDPDSSEGYLCLIKKLPAQHFDTALDRLLQGKFSWVWRQRIRVTLSGKRLERPIELHDMQLMHPEHRWSEHVREHEEARLRSHSSLRQSEAKAPTTPALNGDAPLASFSLSTPINRGGTIRVSNSSPDGSVFHSPDSVAEEPAQDAQAPEVQTEELPVLALNDIFIGESLSSRVSYYELRVDAGPTVKQKSSGLTVCTGTGSTSWYFNMSRLTEQCVKNLLEIAGSELGSPGVSAASEAKVAAITQRFNDQLIFSPADTRMAYAIRDPVYNATFVPVPPRGFASSEVVVKSRCFDAHLVLDGGMSYIFNDGASATLQLLPEDALRTVVFR